MLGLKPNLKPLSKKMIKLLSTLVVMWLSSCELYTYTQKKDIHFINCAQFLGIFWKTVWQIATKRHGTPISMAPHDLM